MGEKNETENMLKKLKKRGSYSFKGEIEDMHGKELMRDSERKKIKSDKAQKCLVQKKNKVWVTQQC